MSEYSIVLLLALLLAGCMGYAVQRGATCTVAAVDEVLTRRRGHRLLALVEASIWVLGGLLIGKALGWVNLMPAGYRITGLTLLGAVLLGLGAAINRACVFGAIARFGSGEWAYLATPAGFYLGCLAFQSLFADMTPEKLPDPAHVLQAPVWIAGLIAAWMAWRFIKPLLTLQRDRDRSALGSAPGYASEATSESTSWPMLAGQWLSAKVWSPHAATLVIGVSFFFLFCLEGTWAYTDVLTELAHGMSKSFVVRGLLFVALLAGSASGGWTAGRFRHTRITAMQLCRCLLGGAMMALGGRLIPGSNDGLILLGMPLLWPYAWIAFLTMCLTVAAYQTVTGIQKQR